MYDLFQIQSHDLTNRGVRGFLRECTLFTERDLCLYWFSGFSANNKFHYILLITTQSVITFFVVTFSKPSLFYLLCSRRAYSFLRLPPVWIERSRISAISSNITLFHSPNVPSFIFLRVYLTLCDNRVAYPETDDAPRYTLEAHHKRLWKFYHGWWAQSYQ